MECDSAHSLIERKIKGTDIFLPSDFIKITQNARLNPKPFEAKIRKYINQFVLELVLENQKSKISVH